jgi:hypothetical protein
LFGVHQNAGIKAWYVVENDVAVASKAYGFQLDAFDCQGLGAVFKDRCLDVVVDFADVDERLVKAVFLMGEF